MDLFLIELVPLAKRIASQPIQQPDAMFVDTNPPAQTDLDEDAERENMYFRLEPLGFRVGQGIAERFSRDRPRFVDTMDVIKFLCKDLWTILFRRQIDNLKTNHRVIPLVRCKEAKLQGVYVLTDNNFRWFSRMSTVQGGQDAVNKAQPVRPPPPIRFPINANASVLMVSMWSDKRCIIKFRCRKYRHGRSHKSRITKCSLPNQSRFPVMRI